jgi:dipeptidase E
MKLLLTSGGLTNDRIKQAFSELLGKSTQEARVAVIPTAAKNSKDSSHIAKDLAALNATGIRQIDMVDISEMQKSDWLPLINAADVIFVVGGDVYLLRDAVVNSGLAEELPRLLETKLYVGISAGSKLLGPNCGVASLYYSPQKDNTGLEIVDFCIVPHMNSSRFTDRTPEQVEPKLEYLKSTTYLIDDDTAIVVDGSMMQIIGGEYVEFSK